MFKKIRSTYILKDIFAFLKKRKKLNLLKYNKNLRNKLDIKKKDYQEFLILNDFNIKFNLNIRNIELEELTLRNKNLGNDILILFKKIRFDELKVLDLGANMISDIEILENAKLPKLESLDLSLIKYRI